MALWCQMREQEYWAKYQKRNNHTMCFRCQSHGYAQRNYFAPPKCMKCAGDHLTLYCLKSKNTPAKCANSGGPHGQLPAVQILPYIRWTFVQQKSTQKSKPIYYRSNTKIKSLANPANLNKHQTFTSIYQNSQLSVKPNSLPLRKGILIHPENQN